MKTTNPVLDTLVESQTQFMNNWMESAKKMQSAITGGNISTEGLSLYKELIDKQMGILQNMQQSSTNLFNTGSDTNSIEFFKNWFNQQAAYAKQMADFNQSIQSSVANFGKPAQDYMASFGQSNTAFTNIYNSWLNALNASYESMSKNMNNSFNKDIFSKFMDGSQMYAKMQEYFQPMVSSLQKGQFNLDAFKNQFTAETYSNLAKQMFSGFYNEASVKEVYDNAIKKLHEFFTGQNDLSKQYFEQVSNISKNFPGLFNNSGNFKEIYSQMGNIFGKTFEPLLKIVNPGKEKDNAEAIIALLDKITAYSIRQTELQTQLQTTAKKSVEKIAKQYADKFSTQQNLTQVPSVQEMYSEWVKVNEQLFTELFASEEFSKVKGETINLSMEVKKLFEKQFEDNFAHLPIVFKGEVEALHKTIYDLKKMVKDLQSNFSLSTPEMAEEGQSKSRKK